MGVCVETLQRACKLTIEETANTIQGEMKGIVGGHTRSGLALGAIHIEMGSNRAFVGGTGGEGTLHLFFLDEGNGSKTIRPKRARALHFSDGTYHAYARPYKGIHFVHMIASRHGG